MGKSVTFNVDKLIKKLDLIEKVHVPKAAEEALRSFGFDVRELLQKEMAEKYESPSAYTLRSPFFRQEGMTLTVGISDKAISGLAPNQFLAPTDATHGRGRRLLLQHLLMAQCWRDTELRILLFRLNPAVLEGDS